MTIDDHTAAWATGAIVSGISDLKEMMAAGEGALVSIELERLTEALVDLGGLISKLYLKEIPLDAS